MFADANFVSEITRTNLERTHIYFFVVGILMYKQICFIITAAVMLTAFATVALYTGSVHAQAPGAANMTKGAIAGKVANMTKGAANMTKGAIAGKVANMTK
jgi:hypothetical protein